MLKKLICVLLVGSLSSGLQGQEIKPRGYFGGDSIKIGEVINYTLILEYPRGMEVLFPDSTFNYAPFEYVDRSYLSTESTLSHSIDSVVYQLSTFEMDSIQRLSLPVFVMLNGDSTAINTPVDSLFLKFLITTESDTLDIQDTAQFQNVSKAFNYPYLLIALGILAVIGLAVLIFFGAEIRKRLKLFRMRKAHQRFLSRFSKLQQAGFKQVKEAENLLGFWKKYLEQLEGMPYTKLTTKEIVTIEDNQEFRDTLSNLDLNIYGRFEPNDIHELSDRLKQFGEDRYQQKVGELKNV